MSLKLSFHLEGLPSLHLSLCTCPLPSVLRVLEHRAVCAFPGMDGCLLAQPVCSDSAGNRNVPMSAGMAVCAEVLPIDPCHAQQPQPIWNSGHKQHSVLAVMTNQVTNSCGL